LKLEEMARVYRVTGGIPLFTELTSEREHLVLSVAPNLEGRKALFLWTHPITGIGTSAGPYGEIYGNAEALIHFRIAPHSRALKISHQTWTDDEALEQSPVPGLENYDLILHELRHRRDEVVLREWIVLNPKILLDPTSYSEALGKRLEKEVENLSRPEFFYRRSQLHHSFGGVRSNFIHEDREIVIKLVNKFLRSRDKIPTIFSSSKVKPARCRNFL